MYYQEHSTYDEEVNDGCEMHNADDIIPELLHLEVGDSIPMHPSICNPYIVAAIEPGRALILLIRADMETGNTIEPTGKMPEKYQNSSWLFFLDENDDGTTRLISRSRNDWNQSPGNTVFYGLFGPLTLEMDRKLLLGIKQRAEGLVNH